jgi:hypothetical protein
MVSGLQTSKGEFRIASASTGTGLTTTAAFIQLPRKTDWVALTPRNFSGAVVARIQECPWLIILKTLNSLTHPPIDYSEAAQDGSTDTDIDMGSMEAASTGGYLYVGSHVPFRGVSIDVDATNAGDANALTVRYASAKGTWSDIGDTDNTSGSSNSLNADGTVVWTVPTDWGAYSLQEMGDTKIAFPDADVKRYWTRWEWSAAFSDATVTLNSIVGLNRSSAYYELVNGQALQGNVLNGVTGISGFECLTDSGTANIVINARTYGRFS